MSRLILLNKPYGVLCQFTDEAGRATLKDCVAVPGVYAAGRLDTDSEGLLLLTDDGPLQHRIADPRHKLAKTYLVQVEGEPDETALARLRAGLDLGDFHTRPCEAKSVAELPKGAVVGSAALSQVGADALAGDRAARGQEPPGAAYDRKGWLPHAAPDPDRDRPVAARRAAARSVA